MNNDHSDNFTNNIAKLRWACRRGMLELDVLLGNFLETGYISLSDEEKADFVRLLTYSDPELFDWLMGYSIPEDKNLLRIIELIRQHGRSRI